MFALSIVLLQSMWLCSTVVTRFMFTFAFLTCLGDRGAGIIDLFYPRGLALYDGHDAVYELVPDCIDDRIFRRIGSQ